MKLNCHNCTGCGACYSICPKGAIKMQENSEGFLHPMIDEKLCINCGKCERICPELNKIEISNNRTQAFAVIAKDEYKDNASSGGVFGVLAKNIIQKGGYVCGAIFNDNWEVEHTIISEEKDLWKLKGSKYVQSRIGNCYIEIKKLLEKNNTVLFSGTPCQVAGLYKYLNKEYENLITVDVLCHGAPSPKAFRQYLKENFKDEKIEKINFRHKLNDAVKQLILNIKTDKRSYIMPSQTDNYYNAFSANLINRKSCAKCQYTSLNRVGDITLGDFWGLQKYKPEINPHDGISLMMFNEKGRRLFESIKSEFDDIEEIPIEVAKNGNQILYKPFKPHPMRKRFFKNIDKKSFNKNVQNCFENKYDVGILNLWYSANYGAVLTAYALQEVLNSLGYSAQIINNCTDKYIEKLKFYNGFETRYLSITDVCTQITDYKALNDNFDAFIVGSDQVFRPEYRPKDYMRLFLDFVRFDKKKIAFSASFGTEYLNCNNKMFNNIKNALKTFDYISTREISGKDICKNYFDIDCDWTLDPVFIAGRETFDNLAKESKKDFSNKIISYVLDTNEEYEKLYSKVISKHQKEIYKLSLEKDDVLDFVKAFSQAESIITDSFHGVCFAIIFNKPFVCIANKRRGYARFDSLFQTFDIKQCFYEKIENCVNNFIDFEKPNYENINNKIVKLSDFAKEKLLTVLNAEKSIDFDSLKTTLLKLENENIELKKEIEDYKPNNSRPGKYYKVFKLLTGFYNV